MGLDIRLPLGLIFIMIGGLLTLYGAITRGSPIYASSMNVNLNLGWGAVMLLFGILMLVASRKK